MSKTITIRVSEEEYAQIVAKAKADHRTISNLMLHATLNSLEGPYKAKTQTMEGLFPSSYPPLSSNPQ